MDDSQPKSKKVALVTRIHKGASLTNVDPLKLVDFVRRGSLYSDQLVICVRIAALFYYSLTFP